MQMNMLCTSGLLQNCVEHGVGEVVFTSPVERSTARREFLTTEDHPKHLLSCYEFSKLAAECYLYY